MKFQITRKTGFFAFGSPLILYQEKTKIGGICEGETQTLQLSGEELHLQVRFSLLKSPYYNYKQTTSETPMLKLVIKINPTVMGLYLGFFLIFLLGLPLIGNWFLYLAVILAYGLFFCLQRGRFYRLYEEG